MDLPNYDQWRTDNGEKFSPPVGRCECCDEEIYEGNSVYFIPDGMILKDHWDDFVKKVLDAKEGYAR
jgi:hypothetical protein